MKTIRLNGSPELQNRIFYGHVTGLNPILGGVNVCLDENIPDIGVNIVINPRSGLTMHRPYFETDLLSVNWQDLPELQAQVDKL